MKTRMLASWVTACVCLLALPGWGFDLASDQNLTGNPSVLTGVGAGNVITNRAITGGNVYDWADVNGDGVRSDPVATPGLNLGGYKLTNTSGSHIVLDLAGGNVTGTGTAAVATRSSSGNSGRIEIQTATDVDCGGLDTSAAGGGGNSTGDILMGSTNNRAGNIRIGYLTTRSGGFDINPGLIAVYGSGHVRVMDGTGAPSDIQTWTGRNWYTGVPDSAGAVTVVHDGEFLARNIYTYHLNDNFSRGGHVLLNGDGAGNGASGACSVTNIYTYSIFLGAFGARGGNVTITGYSSVRVAKIDTRSGRNITDAGDVTITNIAGSIEITGVLDLRNLSDSARAGDLVLRASGAVNLTSLDLALLKSATVSSPVGIYIDGILANFPTATPANGVLDAPPGTSIYYKSKLSGNAYLGGNTYDLKSGGKLRSELRGAVLSFQ